MKYFYSAKLILLAFVLTACAHNEPLKRSVANSESVTIQCKYSSSKKYDNTDYEPKYVTQIEDDFIIENVKDEGPFKANATRDIVDGKLNIYSQEKGVIVVEYKYKNGEVVRAKSTEARGEVQLINSFRSRLDSVAYLTASSTVCSFMK